MEPARSSHSTPGDRDQAALAKYRCQSEYPKRGDNTSSPAPDSDPQQDLYSSSQHFASSYSQYPAYSGEHEQPAYGSYFQRATYEGFFPSSSHSSSEQDASDSGSQ